MGHPNDHQDESIFKHEAVFHKQLPKIVVPSIITDIELDKMLRKFNPDYVFEREVVVYGEKPQVSGDLQFNRRARSGLYWSYCDQGYYEKKIAKLERKKRLREKEDLQIENFQQKMLEADVHHDPSEIRKSPEDAKIDDLRKKSCTVMLILDNYHYNSSLPISEQTKNITLVIKRKPNFTHLSCPKCLQHMDGSRNDKFDINVLIEYLRYTNSFIILSLILLIVASSANFYLSSRKNSTELEQARIKFGLTAIISIAFCNLSLVLGLIIYFTTSEHINNRQGNNSTTEYGLAFYLYLLVFFVNCFEIIYSTEGTVYRPDESCFSSVKKNRPSLAYAPSVPGAQGSGPDNSKNWTISPGQSSAFDDSKAQNSTKINIPAAFESSSDHHGEIINFPTNNERKFPRQSYCQSIENSNKSNSVTRRNLNKKNETNKSSGFSGKGSINGAFTGNQTEEEISSSHTNRDFERTTGIHVNNHLPIRSKSHRVEINYSNEKDTLRPYPYIPKNNKVKRHVTAIGQGATANPMMRYRMRKIQKKKSKASTASSNLYASTQSLNWSCAAKNLSQTTTNLANKRSLSLQQRRNAFSGQGIEDKNKAGQQEETAEINSLIKKSPRKETPKISVEGKPPMDPACDDNDDDLDLDNSLESTMTVNTEPFYSTKANSYHSILQKLTSEYGHDSSNRSRPKNSSGKRRNLNTLNKSTVRSRINKIEEEVEKNNSSFVADGICRNTNIVKTGRKNCVEKTARNFESATCSMENSDLFGNYLVRKNFENVLSDLTASNFDKIKETGDEKSVKNPHIHTPKIKTIYSSHFIEFERKSRKSLKEEEKVTKTLREDEMDFRKRKLRVEEIVETSVDSSLVSVLIGDVDVVMESTRV